MNDYRWGDPVLAFMISITLVLLIIGAAIIARLDPGYEYRRYEINRSTQVEICFLAICKEGE